MSGTCRTWFNLIASGLGIFLGISACIIFAGVYNNLHAGVWGFISAVFASITFHLHVLYHKRVLEAWHSVETLQQIKFLGLATLLSGLAGMSWYLFLTFYKHIPVMPVSDSTAISSVWAFMTAKWGLMLLLSAHRYSNHVSREEPLIT